MQISKMEHNSYHYIVAGHAFSIGLPTGPLGQYKPFEVPAAESGDEVFHLEVEPVGSIDLGKAGELLQRLNDEPPYLWLYKNEGREDMDDTSFGFSLNGRQPVGLVELAKDGTQGTPLCRLQVLANAHASEAECAINNALMLLYMVYTTKLGTLMIHSSVTMWNGGGYAFLGKSGTGKSTHSSLWLKNIESTELLNDDNPVVRHIDGKSYIYGSPWSGKTPCYKNRRVELKAIVQLSQAPFNRITSLRGLEAYAAFMPSCSSIKWKKELADALNATIEAVIMSTKTFHLECLPDDDAAFTCFNEVTK